MNLLKIVCCVTKRYDLRRSLKLECIKLSKNKVKINFFLVIFDKEEEKSMIKGKKKEKGEKIRKT